MASASKLRLSERALRAAPAAFVQLDSYADGSVASGCHESQGSTDPRRCLQQQASGLELVSRSPDRAGVDRHQDLQHVVTAALRAESRPDLRAHLRLFFGDQCPLTQQPVPGRAQHLSRQTKS